VPGRSERWGVWGAISGPPIFLVRDVDRPCGRGGRSGRIPHRHRGPGAAVRRARRAPRNRDGPIRGRRGRGHRAASDAQRVGLVARSGVLDPDREPRGAADRRAVAGRSDEHADGVRRRGWRCAVRHGDRARGRRRASGAVADGEVQRVRAVGHARAVPGVGGARRGAGDREDLRRVYAEREGDGRAAGARLQHADARGAGGRRAGRRARERPDEGRRRAAATVLDVQRDRAAAAIAGGVRHAHRCGLNAIGDRL